MTVAFSNVGRDKKSWTLETNSLADATLIRSIRKQDALMSGIIIFGWSKDGTEAKIGVGPFARVVGTLRVQGGAKL